MSLVLKTPPNSVTSIFSIEHALSDYAYNSNFYYFLTSLISPSGSVYINVQTLKYWKFQFTYGHSEDEWILISRIHHCKSLKNCLGEQQCTEKINVVSSRKGLTLHSGMLYIIHGPFILIVDVASKLVHYVLWNVLVCSGLFCKEKISENTISINNRVFLTQLRMFTVVQLSFDYWIQYMAWKTISAPQCIENLSLHCVLLISNEIRMSTQLKYIMFCLVASWEQVIK